MKRNKSVLTFVLISLMSFFIILLSPFQNTSFGAEVRQFQMVGASMGGVIYRWLAAFSKVYNEELKGAQFTVRTGSPPENVLMIESGDADLAGSGPVYYSQVHPDDPSFAKTRVRALWPMFSVCRYLVVPQDSPYRTYSDLKGKKIAVGIKTAEGGDFLEMAKAIGWKDKDMKFYYVGKREGIAAYKDGTVDAWTGWTTPKSPHFMQLAASKRGAKLISFNDEEIGKIITLYPNYVRGTIPAGAHKKITKASPSIFNWLTLIVRDDFPEDVAYQLAKAMDKRLSDVVAVFKGAADATAENAAKYHFFKLHPGTLRYLREKGLK